MIPKELYTHLSIKKTELANSNEPYRAGCVGSATIPSMQVQYVAIDKHNHYIISIASGGKTHRTLYYFIDKAKGKCNINELFFGNSARLISFGKIVMRVNTKDFKFI